MTSNILETKWFPDVLANYTENIFKNKSADTAITFINERLKVQTISYSQLYFRACRFSKMLESLSCKAGDYVLAYIDNSPSSITAMLSCLAKGIVWSSIGADYSTEQFKHRLLDVRPRFILISGKFLTNSFLQIAKDSGWINSKKYIIIILDEDNEISISAVINRYSNFYFTSELIKKFPTVSKMRYQRQKFSEPILVMYTSGTTGQPKKLYQGLGVLLNHLKELSLHIDLKPREKILFFTQPSWMMWNWFVSALGLGANLVIYEGGAFWPQSDILIYLAAKYKINYLGAGASYFEEVKNLGIQGKKYNLKKLKKIISTGSRLGEEYFQYLNSEIEKNASVVSMSGGSEINGCFATGHPNLPIKPGRIQCKALGVDLHVMDELGNSVKNRYGELICMNSLPNLPIKNKSKNDFEKTSKNYLIKENTAWLHGDLAMIDSDGYVDIADRSDNIIVYRGVKIGPYEIKPTLSLFPEVKDFIFTSYFDSFKIQKTVLFLKLNVKIANPEELGKKIKQSILTNLTRYHIPGFIFIVKDIPYTQNGKKADLLVKKILNGKFIRTDVQHIRNPSCLNEFQNFRKHNV